MWFFPFNIVCFLNCFIVCRCMKRVRIRKRWCARTRTAKFIRQWYDSCQCYSIHYINYIAFLRITLHLHYITLHSYTFHYLPIHSITFLCIPLLSYAFHYPPIPSITFLSIPLPSYTHTNHCSSRAFVRCWACAARSFRFRTTTSRRATRTRARWASRRWASTSPTFRCAETNGGFFGGLFAVTQGGFWRGKSDFFNVKMDGFFSVIGRFN